MKTITVKTDLYLHLDKYNREKREIWMSDMTDIGYILITKKEFELSFSVPDDLDLTQLEVDALNKEKAKIQAETHLKVQNIEDQIQRLLAIGHDGEGK